MAVTLAQFNEWLATRPNQPAELRTQIADFIGGDPDTDLDPAVTFLATAQNDPTTLLTQIAPSLVVVEE